jgi:hypothetical protein
MKIPLQQIRPMMGWDSAKALLMSRIPADQFPPITVQFDDYTKTYTVTDGHHRFVAAIIRGDSEIEVAC